MTIRQNPSPPRSQAARRSSRAALLLLAMASACGGDTDGEPVEEPDSVAEEALNGNHAPLALPLPEGWTGGLLEVPDLGFRMEAAEGLVAAAGLPGKQGPLPEHALVLKEPARPGNSLVLLAHQRPAGSLDDQFKDALEELRSHCPGFHLLDAGECFTGQGLRGRWLDYQWLVDGKVLSQRQILFVTTEAFFTLTATWTPGDGPGQPDPALQATLDSFDLL